MPRQLQPLAPAERTRLLAAFRDGARDRATLKPLTKHYLALLQRRAPGNSVEVRVPPYAAVQVVAGVRHTRGTPPAVIELDAELWLGLATGELDWNDVSRHPEVTVSGERTDLSGYLPLS